MVEEHSLESRVPLRTGEDRCRSRCTSGKSEVIWWRGCVKRQTRALGHCVSHIVSFHLLTNLSVEAFECLRVLVIPARTVWFTSPLERSQHASPCIMPGLQFVKCFDSIFCCDVSAYWVGSRDNGSIGVGERVPWSRR